MQEEELKTVLRDFIVQAFLPGKTPEDVPDDLNLLESGMIDSLALMEVVSFLQDFLGLPVRGEEISPANFNSINTMVRFARS